MLLKIEKGTVDDFDGYILVPMPYTHYTSGLKSLFQTILGRENVRYASPVARKTSYLVAILGGGDIGAIQLAARHKSIKNAEKYAKGQLAIHQSSKKKAEYVELM